MDYTRRALEGRRRVLDDDALETEKGGRSTISLHRELGREEEAERMSSPQPGERLGTQTVLP